MIFITCIGGPISALDNLSGALGGQVAIKYMSSLIRDINSVYRPRVDFFPENFSQTDAKMNKDPVKESMFVDVDIPDYQKVFEEDEKVKNPRKMV